MGRADSGLTGTVMPADVQFRRYPEAHGQAVPAWTEHFRYRGHLAIELQARGDAVTGRHQTCGTQILSSRDGAGCCRAILQESIYADV